MELKVHRLEKTLKSSIGRFVVGGTQIGWSLEDRDRGLKDSMTLDEIKQIKVKGETAIPKGRYKVILAKSEKFKNKPWVKPYDGLIPVLENVKGYSGVCIHVGNSYDATLGCILVAKEIDKKNADRVLRSTDCFNELMSQYLVPAWKRGEPIWITVE